ncbi:MAG: hypothetical protein AB1665_07325 [Candidatus Thermoplasmatota archaeon]
MLEVIRIAEGDTASVRLEHFVYGNDKGYRMMGQSDPKNLEMYTEPYRGFYLPVSQSYVKEIKEPLRVIVSGGSFILFSRISQSQDEIGRLSLENHSAVVPRNLLSEGKIDYEALDRAMEEFESTHHSRKGNIPQMEIPIQARDLGQSLAELSKYLPREKIEALISLYTKDTKKKIILQLPRANFQERTKIAYLLSLLIDIKLGVVPISVFPDVPYPDATDVFSLIITQKDPGIKPTRRWAMIVFDPIKERFSAGTTSVEDTLDSIFKSD